jgi:hypothetical protein
MDRPPEPEHQGSLWKHPYMIYIVLTAALFAGLLAAGWFALNAGLIPSRGL